MIDSNAGTALPADNPDLIEPLKAQISNLSHHLRHDADVLVIGSGGGTDVRSALVFNDKSVTGVEINRDSSCISPTTRSVTTPAISIATRA